MKAVLYTDGGARGNPGPGAIGVVLKVEGREPLGIAELIGEVTNNVAEYRALLRGLQEARRRGVTNLECRLDSELVVGQLTAVYKVRNKNLAPLFVQVRNAAREFPSIRFRAVARAENREADALVNAVLARAGYPKKDPPAAIRR